MGTRPDDLALPAPRRAGPPGAPLGRRLTLAARLHRALRRDELVLHAQPIAELATGRVVGHEALIRWQDPEQGLLAPDAFLAHAEVAGLMAPIGAWVADAACRQLRVWRDLGIAGTLAVNVGPRQLERSDLGREVADAVARHGVRAEDLVVEITETAAIVEPRRALAALAELRALGVALAIDDFGARHASFARVRDLPVQVLKLDRLLLDGVPGDPRAAELVRAVLALAAALGMDAVAEGVETQEQRAFLAAAGCRLGQGFHLGRPVPLAEATRRLLAGRGGAAVLAA